MNIKKLFFSFLLIIIIAIISAFLTVSKMNELSLNTQKMYSHPFIVNNALSDIQTGIITIHKNMKDIVLSVNPLEIIKIAENIQHEEDKVLKNFDVIYKNYLGNKKDIDTSYQTFIKWKEIREKVLVKMYENKIDEAITITKEESAIYINKIHEHIKVLKDFALNKANEFYKQSLKNSGVKYVVTVISITVLISALIILYVINTLLKANESNNKQLYLIDQNILMAQLSLDKRIIEISNALCRTLNEKKENIINTTNEYFFTDKSQFELFENIIYSAKEFTSEVYIIIDGSTIWFNMEIFPALDNKFKLKYFNIFLTNITDRKKIEEIAIIDTLTGLNNRNYFETIFDKEVKRAKRDHKSLSMIMLDIDFFKQYNDSYGHQSGDKALKSVSQIIQDKTNRSYDHAFRIGGEEFVILTYQENLLKLDAFTQKIIKEIEELKIPHKTNEISDYLTISAGATIFDKNHLLNIDEMYKIVDDLLYTSKKEGRNRLTSKAIS
jgi:diguanylate cyclase (GGDEF)-like protein